MSDKKFIERKGKGRRKYPQDDTNKCLFCDHYQEENAEEKDRINRALCAMNKRLDSKISNKTTALVTTLAIFFLGAIITLSGKQISELHNDLKIIHGLIAALEVTSMESMKEQVRLSTEQKNLVNSFGEIKRQNSQFQKDIDTIKLFIRSETNGQRESVEGDYLR